MADADITTNLGRVRFNTGDATMPYELDDTVINFLLNQYNTKADPVAIWSATVDALTILKGRYAHEAARRRESEGGVTVEEYSQEKYEAINNLLDHWKKNPPVDPNNTGEGLFIFGGVSQKETRRVEDDPDSVLPGIKVDENDDDTIDQLDPRYRIDE